VFEAGGVSQDFPQTVGRHTEIVAQTDGGMIPIVEPDASQKDMCFARRVSTTTDSLPNDIESLRALAAQAITERDVAIAEREAAMKERDAERAEKAKLVAERDRLQSLYACLLGHCCPVDGGYYFIITLQDKGF
jgi:hypothetical protein